MSKLSDALKKRFASPKHALRALGLPEDLLDDLQAEDHSIVGKRRRALKMAMDQDEGAHEHDAPLLREALDKLVRKHKARDDDPMVKELRDIADRHDRTAGDRRRRRADDEEPPMIETMPEENMSADDFEAFKDHLRENSKMSEDEIEQATELAKDYVRKRGANGKDRMPLRGGKFDRARFNHGRTSEDEVNEARQLRGRIEPANSFAPGPDPTRTGDDPNFLVKHNGIDSAMDAAPTELQRRRFFSRFPDARRIGNMSGGSGMGVPSVDLRSSTEKRYPGLARIGRA